MQADAKIVSLIFHAHGFHEVIGTGTGTGTGTGKGTGTGTGTPKNTTFVKQM